MTEEVNVGMGAQAPKKGMSKGCLIALIVGIVILLFVGVTIYYALDNKDDIMKFGVATLLTSSKLIVVESNLAGIDTVYYNAVVDNFNERLYADTSFHLESMAEVFSNIQLTVEDQKMDIEEIESILEALIAKYPDIVSDIPNMKVFDSTQVDSMY